MLQNEIKTNKIYNDEYQHILSEFAGAFGMFLPLVYGDYSNIETKSAIEPLIFTYLAYASEQLQSEGKANNETKAITLAMEEILSYFTNEEIDNNNFTVDDFITLFAKYFTEHEDSEFANAVIKGIIDIVPDNYSFFLNAFKPFAKGNPNDASVEDGLRAYLKACYLGADPESEEYDDFSNPKEVRNSFYTTIAFVANQYVPEVLDVLKDDDNYNNDYTYYK